MQKEIEQLIESSQKMAEHLLKQQNGEFFPFGFKMDIQGQLSNVGFYDGDEFPLSQTKIDELRKYFENEIKTENTIGYSITFNCFIKRDSDSLKTDAIAIECFSKKSEQKILFYFPYRFISKNQIEFGDSWSEAVHH
jgi:hypothetical protein